MAKFEIVSKYEGAGLALPERKTQGSAGYDFQVAEDIIIPSYYSLLGEINQLKMYDVAYKVLTGNSDEINALTLKEVKDFIKPRGLQPTLVPTGIKANLDKGTYLQLSVRSSCPLNSWLVLANGIGIIDADYYNNPDNEGAIYFQLINLSPFDIQLKKGDIIGQGVILPYLTVENDKAEGARIGGFGSTSK